MGAHFIWIVFMVTSGWLRDSQADFCTPSSVSTYDCVFPGGFVRQASFDSCNRTNTCLNPARPTVATGECNGVTAQICSEVQEFNDPPQLDVCSSSPCKEGGKCISQREGVLCCYCNPVTPSESNQACYDPAIVNVTSRTPCAADDGAPPTIDSCNDVRTNKDVVSDIISDLDVTATDNVNNSLPVHCAETSGALHLTSNETTFNCTATDTAGGETTCTFNVVFDQQAPVIDNCPSNVRTNNVVVPWSPNPTATDNDGTTPAVSCIPAAGSSFPVDATTIVVCNASDAAGNEAICTFNVTVDQQAPVINSCPLDVRTKNATVTWSPDPTATDDDGTTPEVTCFPAAGSSFPVDVTSVVCCNASDAAGNEAECIFNVTVDSEDVVVSMAINKTNGSDVPFIPAYNDITSPESRRLCLPVETAMLKALSPKLASIMTAKCIAIYQGSIIVDVRLGFSPEANNSAPLDNAVQGVLQNVITEGTFGAGGGVTYTINPESVIAQSESITCPTDYCQNGGECLREGAVPRVQFSCNCSAGFTGDVCQTSIKGTPLAAILIPVIALVCLLMIIWVCTMTKAGYKQPAAPPELNLMEYDTGERLYRPFHGRPTHESRFSHLGGRLVVNHLAYINRQENF